MDEKIFEELGINSSASYADKKFVLEQAILDAEGRLENANDDERIKELENRIANYNNALENLPKDDEKKETRATGIIVDDGPISTAKATGIVVDDVVDKKVETEVAKAAGVGNSELHKEGKKDTTLKNKENDENLIQEAHKMLKDIDDEKQAEAEAKKVAKEQREAYEKSVEARFKKAMEAYGRGDYKDAFKSASEIANDEGILGCDRKEAEFMIALMYKNGEGVAADSERAFFWFKKASDDGHIEANFPIAEKILSKTPTNDAEKKSIIDDALNYLQRAADADNFEAVKKYIEICKNENVGRDKINKAVRYCDVLKDRSTDAYDKNQAEVRKKELKKKGKTSPTVTGGAVKPHVSYSKEVVISETVSISGMLILIVGLLTFNVAYLDALEALDLIGNYSSLPAIKLAEIFPMNAMEGIRVLPKFTYSMVLNFIENAVGLYPGTKIVAGITMIGLGSILSVIHNSHNNRPTITNFIHEALQVVTVAICLVMILSCFPIESEFMATAVLGGVILIYCAILSIVGRVIRSMFLY